jgi:hypothetical protein
MPDQLIMRPLIYDEIARLRGAVTRWDPAHHLALTEPLTALVMPTYHLTRDHQVSREYTPTKLFLLEELDANLGVGRSQLSAGEHPELVERGALLIIAA